jgi:hypothetical protein
MNYTCVCLRRHYSGRHCEIAGSGTIIRQTVSNCFVSLMVTAMIMFSYMYVYQDDGYIEILF